MTTNNQYLSLSEPAITRILLDVRNSLNAAQQALVEKESAMIANELKLYLSAQELSDLKWVRRTGARSVRSNKLLQELQEVIQKEYELHLDEHHVTNIWKKAEKELPLAGIICNSPERLLLEPPFDAHPCHPRNFSYSCLIKLIDIL